MKRLLIIILALTLCFAGCKEEPKVPDTPEVKHNEEVKAPVEETPTEPTKEPDENVIILPEPDENTKVIIIEFPEDFPEEPYTEPELVSPEDFEWGEYVPFVKYENGRCERHNYFYDYAIITNKVSNLSEGTELYKKLNYKFQIEQPLLEGSFGFCDDISDPKNWKYYDYLFKSRIIHISEDASKIGRFSLIDSGSYDEETNDLFYRTWYSKYELLQGEETIFTDNAYYIDDFSAGAYSNYDYSDFCILNSNSKLYCPIDNNKLLFRTEKEAVFVVENKKATNNIEYTYKTHYIYSLDNNSLDFIVTTTDKKYCISPNIEIFEETEINQFLKNKYVSLSFNKYVYEINEDWTSFVDYYSLCSIYNCNSNKNEIISTYAEAPLISPDLKYLIYSAPPAQFEGFSENNNLFEMQKGFYIKNIKNGNTLFFEVFDGLYYYVCNWVNKENLVNLIE